MLSRIVLACFLHLLVCLHLKAAETARIIIIQPGYPGSTRDAEGFVSQLADYVGGKTGLQGISGEYHNEEKRALSALAEKRASFGLVSLGFYLGHRQELGLRVLLQSKPKDNYVVVARKGEVKDVASLAGQPVAGGPLQEGRFLERIAL